MPRKSLNSSWEENNTTVMDQAQSLRNIIKLNQQSLKPEHARVIAVTSGKGGVGKSSVVTNLAICMARMGKRVVIFDADFGLANIEVMFGLTPQYTVSDVIYKGRDISDIITKGPLDIGFISGGSGVVAMNNLNDMQRSYLIKNMNHLDDICDVVLIDTGAGVSDSVLDFVRNCPEVLLVTTPDPSSLTDAYSLLKALSLGQKEDSLVSKVSIIPNKILREEEGKGIFQKLNTVSKRFLGKELQMAGMIPQDPYMEKSIRTQKPVSLLYPEAKSSAAFEKITSSLLDKPEAKKEKRGISYLFSMLLKDRRL